MMIGVYCVVNEFMRRKFSLFNGLMLDHWEFNIDRYPGKLYRAVFVNWLGGLLEKGL